MGFFMGISEQVFENNGLTVVSDVRVAVLRK